MAGQIACPGWIVAYLVVNQLLKMGMAQSAQSDKGRGQRGDILGMCSPPCHCERGTSEAIPSLCITVTHGDEIASCLAMTNFY